MYCSKCRKKTNKKVCPKCGSLLKKKIKIRDDRSNIYLNIISFLCPLMGLILFFTLKNKTPNKGRKCIKWALIGFIVEIIIISLIVLLLFLFAKVEDTEIGIITSEIKDIAIERYEEDKLDYSKCYSLNEFLIGDSYVGSVKVTKVDEDYNVVIYLTTNDTYFESEFTSNKRISFNMKKSTNPIINLSCH